MKHRRKFYRRLRSFRGWLPKKTLKALKQQAKDGDIKGAYAALKRAAERIYMPKRG